MPNRIGRAEPRTWKCEALRPHGAYRRPAALPPTIKHDGWNALAIGALAAASRAFGREDMLTRARRARSLFCGAHGA